MKAVLLTGALCADPQAKKMVFAVFRFAFGE